MPASFATTRTEESPPPSTRASTRPSATDGTVAVLTVDQDSQVPGGYVGALVDGWARAERDGLRVGLVAPEHVTGLPAQAPVARPSSPACSSRSPRCDTSATSTNDLFIDGVDDDYALRCLDAGLGLVVAEGLTLGHRLGDTHEIHFAGRTVTLTRSAPFRYYYLTRNRTRLIGRHARRHPRWSAGQVVGVAGHLGLVVAFDPERGTRAREAWRGFRDGIRGADRRPTEQLTARIRNRHVRTSDRNDFVPKAYRPEPHRSRLAVS